MQHPPQGKLQWCMLFLGGKGKKVPVKTALSKNVRIGE